MKNKKTLFRIAQCLIPGFTSICLLLGITELQRSFIFDEPEEKEIG